jgi:putative inorganic carbon (HCO3(-)) transporter
MAIDIDPTMSLIDKHADAATPAPRSNAVVAVWLTLAVIVVACAAAATGVLAVRGVPRTELLMPIGVLAVGALIALGCYRFEWFVLAVLGLRSAMDATSARVTGAKFASTVTKAPDAVSSGPAASGMAALFIVLAVIWLLAQHRDRGRTRLTPAEGAFAAFVAACLISVVGAVNHAAALTECARIIAAVLMFVVLARLLTSLASVRRCLIACAIGFVAPVLLGLLQAAGKGTDFRSGGFGRVVGTFAHPNTFGFFLSMFILMAIALFRHCTVPVRWALAFGTLVCGGLLVLTYARGPWIALVLGLIVIGVLQSRLIFVWMVGGIVAVVAAVPSVLSRITDASSGSSASGSTNNSLSWRFDYWQQVIGLNHANPVTGIGLKGTKYLTDQNKAPHNDFLRAYVETGVLGLLAYVLVLVALVSVARRALRNAPRGFPRGVAVGFAAVLLAYVIDSLTDNLMSEVVVLWYFYAAAACAFAVGRLGSPVERSANEQMVAA